MMRHIALKRSLLAAPMIGHLSAYANTLTGLIPDLFSAMDVVSRELVGYIPSVTRNSSAEKAAVGENVTYFIAPPIVGVDIAPAMVIPEPADLTYGNGQLIITKARAYPFGWNGEEVKGLNNGPGFVPIRADSFAQALRAVVNEMENDIATEAMNNASRAIGTAGTTPFATDLSMSAQTRKILDDNGAPPTGRSLIIDTSAGANMRSVPNLTKVNEAGTQMTLRDGTLLDLNGFMIKESAKAGQHTKGTAASSTTTAAGFAIGATSIVLAAAGTGTYLQGDSIAFAGDPNNYQVAVGIASAAAGGTITLAKPGLRQAIPAAATAVTTGGSYTANVAFSQDAIHFVTRAPALPDEGDAAIDRFMMLDQRSGITFEVSVYPGYRKVRYEVAAAWGQKAVKQAHIALLRG